MPMGWSVRNQSRRLVTTMPRTPKKGTRAGMRWGPKRVSGGYTVSPSPKKLKFSTKNVGFHKRDSACTKSVEISKVHQAYVTRSINVVGQSGVNVTAIPAQTSMTDDEHSREKDRIIYKGFKYEIQIRNDEPGVPLTMNIAILSPRHQIVAPTVFDFFRAPNNAFGRGRDFSNNMNNYEMHRSGINTDKYTVLLHKRYIVGPQRSANIPFMNESSKNYMMLKKYVRINRQLRYESDVCSTPIFFLCWLDRYQCIAGTTSTASTATDAFFCRITAYFDEAKC